MAGPPPGARLDAETLTAMRRARAGFESGLWVPRRNQTLRLSPDAFRALIRRMEELDN